MIDTRLTGIPIRFSTRQCFVQETASLTAHNKRKNTLRPINGQSTSEFRLGITSNEGRGGPDRLEHTTFSSHVLSPGLFSFELLLFSRGFSEEYRPQQEKMYRGFEAVEGEEKIESKAVESRIIVSRC